MTMQNINLTSSNRQWTVDLPVETGIAPIDQAIGKLLDTYNRWTRLVNEANQAEALVGQAGVEDNARMTALFNDHPDQAEQADPLEATKSAEERARHARALVDPADRAIYTAYGELVATINANRKPWKKAALAKAAHNRDRVGAALKTLQVASEELRTSLGVIELLTPDHLPAILSASSASRGIFNLQAGSDVVRDGLTSIDIQIRSVE